LVVGGRTIYARESQTGEDCVGRFAAAEENTEAQAVQEESPSHIISDWGVSNTKLSKENGSISVVFNKGINARGVTAYGDPNLDLQP